MSIIPLPEVYWREADRLRSMADAFFYAEAREEFLRLAAEFERLARNARRSLRKQAERETGTSPSPRHDARARGFRP